jgi:hypothetical protein
VDRQNAVRTLAVGHIFHGEGSNGASLICLVTAVTEATIHARTMTTQYDLEFDRQTGVCEFGNGTGTIDSIAALPADIREALLGLDRRYRSGGEGRLSDAEKRALIFVASFYPANPV